RRPDHLGSRAELDHRAEAAPRDRGLHSLRRVAGARQGVDDAPARPGGAQPRHARAEAGVRSVPRAGRTPRAPRRLGALMDYLTRVARFACGIRLADLPGSTVAASKLVLLDTIGAIVAGSAQPENARLAKLAARRAPHGSSSLLGHGLKSDALLAT